ncbi:MAG: hypothetical protein V2I33_02135, partial [Kangiellaceae bacterium]|nr:hypothetical protein [Kangiellaceae bacterium]
MKYPIRLDKLISQTTGYSRKEVKRLLHKDEVSINNEFVRKGDVKVNQDDVVLCLGEEIAHIDKRYFML